jgi:hypothetical protein
MRALFWFFWISLFGNLGNMLALTINKAKVKKMIVVSEKFPTAKPTYSDLQR